MSTVLAAFTRVASLAYTGVGETSSNLRWDLAAVTEDLHHLAGTLGLSIHEWDTPDYVQEIITPEVED